jgi:putative membrane protein insertion efficiency factor
MTKLSGHLKRSTASAESNIVATSNWNISSILSFPFIFLIYAYRATLGQVLSGNCRFYPSCSHYSEDAFKKYGVFKGMLLTIKRLSKCHPWNIGGYDPVE